MKKVISLLICILMIASAVACTGNPAGPTADTTLKTSGVSGSGAGGSGTDGSTAPAKNPIEDVDLNRATIRFMARDDSKHASELFVEEDNGSKIDSATWARELKIENMLNVNIECDKTHGDNSAHGPVDIIIPLITSGDTTYDVFTSSFYMVAPRACEGYFLNYLDPEITNLDLDADYWSQYYIEKSQIGKGIYTITGSAATGSIRMMFSVLFNKNLVESYNVQDPYQMVMDGTWTLDKEVEIGKMFYEDLDKDGKASKDDFYGLNLFNGNQIDGFTSSCDIMFFGRDENNLPVIDVDAGKYQTVLEKLHEICFNSEGTWSEDHNLRGFANSQIIFCHSQTWQCEYEFMREMQDPYGIIPFPKYDESQENYYSYCEDQLTVFALPNTCLNPNGSAAVLEAMAYVGQTDVFPVYYEEVLKHRYFEDEIDGQIIDMMHKNLMLDTAWIYCDYTDCVSQTLRNMMAQGSTNFASSFAKKRGNVEIRLNNMVNKFLALDAE